MQIDSQAAAGAIMRFCSSFVAILATLACPLSAALADSADQNTRRIAVTDQLSLVAAPGWSSCDPAINAKIGAEAPAKMLEKFCTDTPPPDMSVRLVKLQPGGLSVLLVAANRTLEVEFPSATDPSNLDKAKAEVCDQLGAKFFSSGECNIAPMDVAGIPAWGGHAIVATEKGLTQHMRVVAFAMDKHPVLLMFDRLYYGEAPAKFEDDTDVEAMIASLTKP